MKQMFAIILLLLTCHTASAAELPPLPEPHELNQSQLSEQARTMMHRLDYDFRLIQTWLQRALTHAEQQQWTGAQVTIAARLASLTADLREMDAASSLIAQYPLGSSPDNDMFLLDTALNINSYSLNLPAVKEHIESAITLAPTLGRWHQARIWFSVGRAYYQTKQYEKSLPYFSKAQRLYHPQEDTIFIEQLDNYVANIYINLEEYDEATKAYLRLLESSRVNQQYYNEANALYVLGLIAQRQQQWQTAKMYYQLSTELASENSDFNLQAHPQIQLAKIELAHDDFTAASNRLNMVLTKLVPDRASATNYLASLSYLEALIGQDSLVQADLLLRDLTERAPTRATLEKKVTLSKLSYQLALAQGELKLAYERLVTHSTLQQLWLEQRRSQSSKWLNIQLETAELRRIRQELEEQNQQQQLQIQSASEDTSTLKMLFITTVVLTLFAVQLWRRKTRFKQLVERQAMEDYLTGAPNRRAIMDQAKLELTKAAAERSELVFAVVDLDHFKKLNDKFGHDIGDKLLQAFAQICRTHLRQGDYFGRIGGEEWLLVLPNTKLQQVDEVFTRLQQPWQQLKMAGFDHSLPLSFSMGATAATGQELTQLIGAADRCLYQAKNQGRNTVVY